MLGTYRNRYRKRDTSLLGLRSLRNRRPDSDGDHSFCYKRECVVSGCKNFKNEKEEIPGYILYEIALRIDIKEIPKMKMVCKEWNEILKRSTIDRRLQNDVFILQFFKSLDGKCFYEKMQVIESSPYRKVKMDLLFFQRIFKDTWCKTPSLNFKNRYNDYVDFIRPRDFPKDCNAIQGFVHYNRKFWSIKFDIIMEDCTIHKDQIVTIFRRYDDNKLLCFAGQQLNNVFIRAGAVKIMRDCFFILGMLELLNTGESTLSYDGKSIIIKFKKKSRND